MHINSGWPSSFEEPVTHYFLSYIIQTALLDIWFVYFLQNLKNFATLNVFDAIMLDKVILLKAFEISDIKLL